MEQFTTRQYLDRYEDELQLISLLCFSLSILLDSILHGHHNRTVDEKNYPNAVDSTVLWYPSNPDICNVILLTEMSNTMFHLPWAMMLYTPKDQSS